LNNAMQVADQTQRQAKAGVVVMAKLVFPNITAGVAIAGVDIWLATTHGVAAIAAPRIQLASMDAVLAPPLGAAINPACGGLFGPSFAPPVLPKLAAALISAASAAADPAPPAGHTS
jgi:phage-related tail protein